MNKNVKSLVFDIILTALSIALCLGVKTLFHACGPKDDGSFMTCHWAEQAVFALGIALSAMSVIKLIVRDAKMKLGISLAMLPTALVTILIPNILIKLCMMTDMRCHSTMRPAVIIISVLIAIAALLDVLLNRSSAEER